MNKFQNPKISTSILLLITCGIIAGCAGTPSAFRENCSTELKTAWQELDIAKADGFAGTVSYSKAFILITNAKTMQTVENFDGCYKNAKKSRFYIKESRQGR